MQQRRHNLMIDLQRVEGEISASIPTVACQAPTSDHAVFANGGEERMKTELWTLRVYTFEERSSSPYCSVWFVWSFAFDKAPNWM